MLRIPRSFVAAPALITALLLVLAGCSSSTDVATDAGAGIRVVDPVAAAELLEEEPERIVVDVRTPGEFAQGHLEGARLVDYNAPDFKERIAELDRDESYVIYCRSGNRSAGARQVMEDLGFTDVVDVDGGIIAWNQQGLPTTTA